MLRARLLLTAALAAFLILALWPAAAAGHGRQVTVMTRNLFVGTDLTPIFHSDHAGVAAQRLGR